MFLSSGAIINETLMNTVLVITPMLALKQQRRPPRSA
jgi:hypothetical protein